MAELRSNAEWKQWGKEDPLWGVSAWADKQKEGASPWTAEDFYALGKSDWQEFVTHWQGYGINTQSCLEIGCGAGRITKQLAGSFGRVYAVDVSAEMIDYARKEIDGGNVEFSVIDGLHLPQSDCSVSAIFSCHVLQHLDRVELGYTYFGEFFRVLDAGGSIMIHLPLYQFPTDKGALGGLFESLYSAYRRSVDILANTKRRLGVKIMRGTPYPIDHLRRFLVHLGFKNIEFRIFPVKSNGDPHPFVFATK